MLKIAIDGIDCTTAVLFKFGGVDVEWIFWISSWVRSRVRCQKTGKKIIIMSLATKYKSRDCCFIYMGMCLLTVPEKVQGADLNKRMIKITEKR